MGMAGVPKAVHRVRVAARVEGEVSQEERIHILDKAEKGVIFLLLQILTDKMVYGIQIPLAAVVVEQVMAELQNGEL